MIDYVRRMISLLLSAPREIAELEARAEEAYAAMYDTRGPSVKDCHDDAQYYLARAIEIALRSGRRRTAERLRKRKEHIHAVYDHQFRYVR